MSELSKVYVRTMPELTDVPNSDNLLFGELDGLNFIVNRHDGVKPGESFLLVPYEMICPNREDIPEFVRGQRIKPVRLRGVFSCAVCLPNIYGYNEGQDVTEIAGFTKWEPYQSNDDGIQLQSTGSGREVRGPFELLRYDIESIKRFHSEFILDEDVFIQEKIEGENIAITYWDDKLWVRSRARWIAAGIFVGNAATYFFLKLIGVVW